jgi:hypothetical protein
LSAPLVAGAIARYKAARPNASADVVRAWLLSEEASRAQNDPVFGFKGDRDNQPERVLWLGG